MHTIEIMDMVKVCNSFPEIPNTTDVIFRDNILETIETQFNGGIEVVTVEGEESAGKTYLLMQFSLKHSTNAVSLFIRPDCRNFYDPETVRIDICNQLAWYLTNKELSDEEIVDDGLLRNLTTKVQRKYRYKQDYFYFVIDGICDIPEDAYKAKDTIIGMLPLGIPKMRFLFTGDSSAIFSKPTTLKIKNHIIPGFSLSEAEEFLKETKIAKEYIKDIRQTCKGLPGYLESVKHIILNEDDIDIKTFVQQLPDKLPNLFELEWTKIEIDNFNISRILAIVAFDDNCSNISKIASILNISKEDVKKAISDIGFISFENNTNVISYRSSSFRNFVAKKLYALKDEVFDLIISNLMANPNSEDAISTLPKYLSLAEKHTELVQFLSPSFFTETLKRSTSLLPLQEKTAMGMISAKKLENNDLILHYSFSQSLIREMYSADTWRSEIEFLTSIKDFGAALRIVQDTILKEDRMYLLSVVARKQVENNTMPDQDILEQINSLYQEIDPKQLGPKAVDIASELIFSMPDVAIALLEDFASIRLGEHGLDWALAKLSVAAQYAESLGLQDVNISKTVSSKIRNKDAENIARSFSLLFNKSSSKQVIEEVNKIKVAGYRIFIIRNWLSSNQKREDISDVIEYAFGLAIKTTDYSPNATIFYELAFPIHNISDTKVLKKLVDMFDSQKANIEALGPTEEYVKLQMKLAEAEAKYDKEASENRILENYMYYIENLKQLDTKATCLSSILSTMTTVINSEPGSISNDLYKEIENDLNSCVANLLEGTANHFTMIKQIIRTLSSSRQDLVEKYILELNTQQRRDEGWKFYIHSMLFLENSPKMLKRLVLLTENIDDSEEKEQILVKVFEKFCLASNTDDVSNEMMSLFSVIENFIDSKLKCYSYCLLYNYFNRGEEKKHTQITQKCFNESLLAWETIISDSEKVNIGFACAACISETSLEDAKVYYEKVNNFRNDTLFESESLSNAYFISIEILIRIYSAMLYNQHDDEADFNKLKNFIIRVPTKSDRAVLWSQLATRCKLKNRLKQSNDIVQQYIVPILDDLKSMNSDKREYYRLVSFIAPSLYSANQITATKYIEELPTHSRDIAFDAICWEIFSKVPFFEPYDYVEGQGFTLETNEIDSLLDIFARIENDSYLYFNIEKLADSIVNTKKRRPLTAQRMKEIEKKLTDIINLKLPNTKFIKHNGFKICANIQLLRISQSRDIIKWNNFIREANNIPNDADKSFILGTIASYYPHDNTELLKSVKELIDNNPSILDKIEHYRHIATLCHKKARGFSNSLLKDAFLTKPDLHHPEVESAKKTLIDTIHRISPEFGSTLASLTDDDEARADSRSRIKKRLQLHDLKKNVIDGNIPSEKIDFDLAKNFSEISTMLLAMLNSGRFSPQKISTSIEYANISSKLPISMAFPIISFHIENIVRYYESKRESGSILRSLFENSVNSVEFAYNLTNRFSKLRKDSKSRTIDTIDSNFINIKAGEREQAMEFIRTWMDANLCNYFKVADPYFRDTDLELLKIVRQYNPNCVVRILASIKHQTTEKNVSFEECYREKWLEISGETPPETEIVLVGTQSQKDSPIHDRWWITENAGLKLGTSFNSIGTSKISEISIMSKEEAVSKEAEIDAYLYRTIREYNGERLQYQLFTL